MINPTVAINVKKYRFYPYKNKSSKHISTGISIIKYNLIKVREVSHIILLLDSGKIKPILLSQYYNLV